jgi:hypothetical protein
MKTGFSFFGKPPKKFVRKRIETWFSQILSLKGLVYGYKCSFLKNFSFLELQVESKRLQDNSENSGKLFENTRA